MTNSDRLCIFQYLLTESSTRIVYLFTADISNYLQTAVAISQFSGSPDLYYFPGSTKFRIRSLYERLPFIKCYHFNKTLLHTKTRW